MKNLMNLTKKSTLTNSELKQIVGGTCKRPPSDEDINPPLHFSENLFKPVKKIL
jgi:bacteriocin-like protein